MGLGPVVFGAEKGSVTREIMMGAGIFEDAGRSVPYRCKLGRSRPDRRAVDHSRVHL